MTCPMLSYLEEELNKRFNLFRFWEAPCKSEFLTRHSDSVRAVVGNAFFGAESELINALPNLEIVSSYSVGLDKIDLAKCKERGIRVTNTPDVLTDDVADAAIGLTLATLRRICVADGFVRRVLWKNGDFELTTKVRSSFHIFSMFWRENNYAYVSFAKRNQIAGLNKMEWILRIHIFTLN